MFIPSEIDQSAKEAILVVIKMPQESIAQSQMFAEELKELASNLDIYTADITIVSVRKTNPTFFMGEGQCQEVIKKAKAHSCDLIIFDNELSPAQQRNWERASELRVIDRQEIILDIFDRRAQTREASLQVELAQLEYHLPRLRRAWTHLGRQRGGGATQRGEGEAQIELDARIIRKRITKVKKELSQVVKQRNTQRQQRLKVPLPIAALVGYTNAGKSSLLNCLTKSHVLAEDKLFATLDPTTRRLPLDSGQVLLLTDTVGFLQRLPHRLVEAFKATLEEVRLALFLIHVLDISNPNIQEHYDATMRSLKELDADTKPIITVLNKIDRVEKNNNLQDFSFPVTHICRISTHSRQGIDLLLRTMESLLSEKMCFIEAIIPHTRYELIAQLHKHGHIYTEKPQSDGIYLRASVSKRMQSLFAPFLIHPQQ